MTEFTHSRRRFMVLSSATLAAAPWLASCASAEGSAAIPAKAIGMPWPNWGELPDTPPSAPNAGSVGFAVMGLGGYGIGKVLPALANGERCHVAAEPVATS